jgi:MoaA/NifB/PqqE/SkfB family radical SAM enzyme
MDCKIEHRENDDPAAPGFINYIVQIGCNLNCPMCLSNQGGFPTARPEEISDFFGRLARWLGPGHTVLLTGGEAMLHPNIYNYIARLAALNFVPALNTNGVALSIETIDRLVSAGLAKINISLDGIGDIHDNLRNAPGLYGGITDMLPHLANSTRLSVNIASVITAKNAHGLPDLVLLLENSPRIDSIRFQAVTPTLSLPWSWDFFEKDDLWPKTQEQKAVVENVLAKLEGMARASRLIKNPPSQFALWRRYFNDPRSFFKMRECRVDENSLQIFPDGTLGYCNRFPRLGTIRDDPAILWASPKNESVRRAMRSCDQPCNYYLNCCYSET